MAEMKRIDPDWNGYGKSREAASILTYNALVNLMSVAPHDTVNKVVTTRSSV